MTSSFILFIHDSLYVLNDVSQNCEEHFGLVGDSPTKFMWKPSEIVKVKHLEEKTKLAGTDYLLNGI
jgi:hypothetical protein